MNDLVKNPFQKENVTMPLQSSSALAEQQRAMTEVQAALVIAQSFPRDTIKAVDAILQACMRPTLAESAIYSYQRGGSEITGPSIRLAEAIAQLWGNMQFGIRELSQGFGKSTVQAFAWDVQNNLKNIKEFDVAHIRYTRNGTKKLEDPRDIYELVASQGARRVRACILSLIPGDVIEAAVKQCETTLESKIDVSPENVKKMVSTFENEFGVTLEMLEKRMGRRIDTINRPQMVQLHKIYTSLKDGMSTPATWFEVVQKEEELQPSKIIDSIKNKLTKRKSQTESVAVNETEEMVAKQSESENDGA